MDDADGGLSFDFEGNLDAGPTSVPTTSATLHHSDFSTPSSATAAASDNPPSSHNAPSDSSPAAAPGGGGGGGRRSFRQTVCRHWLRGLCMKGEACGFLHQYDKSRMPICRFFRLYGECREQDCVYKHTNEDIKECNMYKLGFCPNGPDCRYRHAKLPGPPPPVEEVLQKIQHLNNFNYGNSNRFFQHRGSGNPQQADKFQFPQGHANVSQSAAAKISTPDSLQHQQQQAPESQQNVSQGSIPNGLSNQVNKASNPLPQGVTRCVWSTSF